MLARLSLVYALLVSLVAALDANAEVRVLSTARHGNLTIFYLQSDDTSSREFISLDSALRAQEVEIQENGTHTPIIRNLAHHYVFVPSGTLLRGGQQDRIIAFDNVLEPKGPDQRFKVFCIEKERSFQRGSEPLMVFSSAQYLAPSAALRMAPKHALALAVPSRIPIEGETVTQPEYFEITPDVEAVANLISSSESTGPAQEHLWRTIDTTIARLEAAAARPLRDTMFQSSLLLAVDNLQAIVPSKLLNGPGGANGIAYAIGGRIKGCETFCSNALFQQLKPQLVHAFFAEALASDRTTPDASTAEDLERFLNSFKDKPSVSRFISYSTEAHSLETQSGLMVKTILTSDQTVVHTSYISK